MEATTIGAEMLLKHCLVQGKILWRLQTLFPWWNLFTLFLFICFFFLSTSSSSFILHFSGKNELAKIAALVVDQLEIGLASLLLVNLTRGLRNQRFVCDFCAIVDAYHLIRTQFHL